MFGLRKAVQLCDAGVQAHGFPPRGKVRIRPHASDGPGLAGVGAGGSERHCEEGEQQVVHVESSFFATHLRIAMYAVQYNFTALSISFRYRGMRFHQLQYFVAVAEELHFGRAAKRLHMSQPPLSQQIRLLEEDLGVRLFDRTSQRVALTREGSFLLREARDVLARLDSARSVLAAMSRGEAGTLRVGYGPGRCLGIDRIPGAMGA